MPDVTLPTDHLPAERLSLEEILAISREIASSPAAGALAVLPLSIAIVNATRQIVYANERFVALAGAVQIEDVLGKRPGEALGCLHAFEKSGGCGTTRFCQYCGAANAIVKSLSGKRATQECAINRKNVTELDALNLQVWASPLTQGEHRLVLNAIIDIAHEKALRSFERIFFHDILNAVAGIKGIHELISLELPQQHRDDLDLLRRAINDIQDIVETQKDFLAVEASEYERAFTALDSRETLGYLATYCQSFSPGTSRTVMVDPQAPCLRFSSDPRIIQRILVNMVKNALEASRPGETVTLGCQAGPDGGVVIWVRNPAVLDEETRMRLFQKGFSTKGVGRGFGAYSMRLFARQCLGGDVDFESSPQEGTRFFLRLPA
ncbi:MAG: HAMP domain-containing sensor histidine kinase [Solidesulfovibrio sp.]|uniref:sensor histidine kinase n=1 Tax=Solidesulfovibrio sp. TaxID=2910990 RepID=UPI0031591249